MSRRYLEKLAEIIGCIDSNGASFELGDVVRAIWRSVSSVLVCKSVSRKARTKPGR